MSQFYMYDCNYNHDHCCRKSLRRSVHLLYHQQPTVKSTARHPCRQRSLFCGLVPVRTVHLVCRHTIRQRRVDRVRGTVQWDSLWRLSLRFNNCDSLRKQLEWETAGAWTQRARQLERVVFVVWTNNTHKSTAATLYHCLLYTGLWQAEDTLLALHSAILSCSSLCQVENIPTCQHFYAVCDRQINQLDVDSVAVM